MWLLEGAFWIVLTLAVALVGAAALLVLGAAQKVRRMPGVRAIPTIGVAPEPVVPDDDLFACPRRLQELETRLTERHQAVADQQALLGARRAGLAAKGSRDDLARNYDQDLALLGRRGASMRRVLAQVWKTRSILLLRARLAATARRRPDLGRLPDPGVAGVDLQKASDRFHEAARRVQAYLARVDEDAAHLDDGLPARPAIEEIDATVLDAVTAERDGVARAYADLREDIDRLADNLTWLGDHCASRAVADAAPEPMDQMGGAARLLDEVEAALVAVSQLSRSVDPALANAALANLDEEISGLEKAGMEARAEAEAVIEVDRLLRQAAG